MLEINRKPPSQKRALQWAPRTVKSDIFQIWLYCISIDCKFYVLSEKQILKKLRVKPFAQKLVRAKI